MKGVCSYMAITLHGYNLNKLERATSSYSIKVRIEHC
jgi:hypothetical protein